MKIIERLKELSESPSDVVKIELKLYNLADTLEKKARNHLKRISLVLPEFDIHDEKHSEKVIQNIEQLLGENQIKNLTSYELFLLHLSAFFHDCAMAPSDWEINTLKITEGTDEYSIDKDSLNNDLNSPFKLSEALKVIESRKNILYRNFKGDVKNWIFTPKSELELDKYLSNLLIDYQNHRNGFADEIKRATNKEDFLKLSEFIRTDYIRATHHIRIETYVKNLEQFFGDHFEQPAWGKKLAADLATICRSHGESASFIKKLSTDAQYYGKESSNLQLVAVMLRLGDIIHFSYDRAPIELRSSKICKSEYSFLQWAIKNNGVNYSIVDGEIVYRAYCESPESYFKLHQYIDWIDYEIQNYFKFERIWGKPYISSLKEKVNRKNINNSDLFLPKRGLSFSLNQKNIIELLMGVGLYKDKFACLRELYQNSLDACRCMIAQNNLSNTITKGVIEFGLEEEGNKVFLYCIDNGIGMSKEIIEKYLLNIGNSYYKSSDFYKAQANWGGDFSPVSQFGIGILSCFMIGDKIEIISKTNNNDFVSCSIDGPHEIFYYKKISDLDKERILQSGTIIRVLLNDESKKKINNKGLEKIGLLMTNSLNYFPEEFESYKKLYQNWEGHLYQKLNQFISVIPDNIDVGIRTNDKKVIEIKNKPFIVSEKELGISEVDLDFLDYLNNNGRFYPTKLKYEELRNILVCYPILILHKKVEYRTTLSLPKAGFDIEDSALLYGLPIIGRTNVCIDGIGVGKKNPVGIDYYYSDYLSRDGIINFTGEIRPQLSVDRTSVINYPDECELIAKEIVELLLKEVISVTKEHITKNQIEIENKESRFLWEFIFDRLGFADTLFINKLSTTEYGEIIWKNLTENLNEEISIKEFLTKDEVSFKDYNISKLDKLSEKLILFRLISASKVRIENNLVCIKNGKIQETQLIQKSHGFDNTKLLVRTNEYADTFLEYDIISNLYPLIPENLFCLLEGPYCRQNIDDRVKTLSLFSNGIMALFEQDSRLVHQSLGMYIKENSALFRKKRSLVYQFENKRSSIPLYELNDRLRSNSSKKRYVITAFINPKDLDQDDLEKLQKLEEEDSTYVKGVQEGWSVLVTGMEKYNMVIRAGTKTRNDMIAGLPDGFWDEYKDYEFFFPNGSNMKK